MTLADRLRAKGWTSAEIDHALLHMNAAETKKIPLVRFTDWSVYWVFLIALSIMIVALVEFVFPFLILLPDSLAYLTILVFGSIFGALFANVLHRMDHLHDAHHTIVLFTALAATVVATRVLLGGELLFGIVFTVAFAMLYCYYWWKK